jgi:XTP/dITP diphosphohydrolase
VATNWFILASGNSHKSEEFNDLFDVDILGARVADTKIEVDESGSTFSENALLKAQAYFQKYQKPVFSDDSGLVVNALSGELGVHSARFGGDGLSDTERSELLLKKLDGEKERSAYFVCVLCFYLSPKEIFFFEGRCHGNIALKAYGDNGFGYDPVFTPEGQVKTFSQEPDWKKSNSHRAKAIKQAERFFAGFFS